MQKKVVKHIIEDKLQLKFSAKKVEIHDNSSRHAGHAGWQPGGETHFSVLIVSNDFEGIPRVKRHKIIYDLLKDELNGGIHALELNLYTEAEFEKLTNNKQN